MTPKLNASISYVMIGRERPEDSGSEHVIVRNYLEMHYGRMVDGPVIYSKWQGKIMLINEA
ncbi:hypothetical protein AD948_07365 [Acetobacter senegalensis]|uniref:Uncharacterized protein n=1 Tax=Acetobacter senegalensis TaxID=446692 RepID=A0A149U3L7_9PROT|nr:hypothetical protein AD948_07365 [Acetobacter senegalensis]